MQEFIYKKTRIIFKRTGECLKQLPGAEFITNIVRSA